MLSLSVIICTHNPREDYLQRALDALANQTLAKEHWELLLIDNASEHLLASIWDLSWHPHAKHIRENELGLTSARLRGINESKASVLVFVDDDNVLSADFLQVTMNIANKWFCLGVWGGQVIAEYETQPIKELEDYLSLLAIVRFETPNYTTERFGSGPRPVGAGMCMRRVVADSYAKRSAQESHQFKLDRVGDSLMSSGDEDMRNESLRLGLGMGMFPNLSLHHLIPSERLEIDYMINLYENIQFSQMLLAWRDGLTPFIAPPGIFAAFRFYTKNLILNYIPRSMRLAHRRASKRFLQFKKTANYKDSPAIK